MTSVGDTPLRLEFSYEPADYQELAEHKVRAPVRAVRVSGAEMRRDSLLSWVVFLGVLGVLVFLLRSRHVSTPPPPKGATPNAVSTRPVEALGTLVTPLATLLVILAVVGYVAFRHRRAGSRDARGGRPRPRGPFRLDLRQDDIELTGPATAMRWRWEPFERWSESGRLFVLHHRDGLVLLIPKRAAPDAAQLDALRELFRRHVAPPTGGFPVRPAPLGGASERAR